MFVFIDGNDISFIPLYSIVSILICKYPSVEYAVIAFISSISLLISTLFIFSICPYSKSILSSSVLVIYNLLSIYFNLIGKLKSASFHIKYVCESNLSNIFFIITFV